MSGDSEHPVTVGDLLVLAIAPSDPESRPATVADLVSALRAEGVLSYESVIEILWRHLRPYASPAFFDGFDGTIQAAAEEIVDALAEAQPFPPAGG